MEDPFSKRLYKWAHGRQPKNLSTLVDAFGDKSFVVLTFFIMLLPALPLPTGGNVPETIVILVALQMIIGRKSVWMPKILSEKISLKMLVKSKHMPKILKRIRWVEYKARPYGSSLFYVPSIDRLFGLTILIFALSSFVAPPFSGLDTLPALGAVVFSLAILLENTLLLGLGLVIGTAGTVLNFFLAAFAVEFINRVI